MVDIQVIVIVLLLLLSLGMRSRLVIRLVLFVGRRALRVRIQLLLRNVLLDLVCECRIDKLVLDTVGALIVVEQRLDFHLHCIDRSVVHALAEAALSHPRHGWRDAVWIYVVVVGALVGRLGRRLGLVSDRTLDKEHLRDVGNLEHLLVIERLVRLNDAWQVDELGGIQLLANVEHSAACILELEPHVIIITTPSNRLTQRIQFAVFARPIRHTQNQLLFKRHTFPCFIVLTIELSIIPLHVRPRLRPITRHSRTRRIPRKVEAHSRLVKMRSNPRRTTGRHGRKKWRWIWPVFLPCLRRRSVQRTRLCSRGSIRGMRAMASVASACLRRRMPHHVHSTWRTY